MSRLLIHIGYYKTGSTWLQREVFSQGALGFDLPFRREQIVGEFIYRHPFDFDTTRCRALFCPAIEASLRCGLVPVISKERLSGAFVTGGYDSKEIADRLVRVFPDATILIVIREQCDMLRSSYSQYIKRGGVLSLDQFLDPDFPFIHRIVGPVYVAEHFLYHRLLRYYFELFGHEQVAVLLYEQLRDDPRAFFRSLLTVAGVEGDDQASISYSPRNVSLSVTSLAIKRRINRLLGTYSYVHPNVPYVSAGLNSRVTRLLEAFDRRLPKRVVHQGHRQMWLKIAARMDGYFAASNRETAGLTALDLGRWGYEL